MQNYGVGQHLWMVYVPHGVNPAVPHGVNPAVPRVGTIREFVITDITHKTHENGVTRINGVYANGAIGVVNLSEFMKSRAFAFFTSQEEANLYSEALHIEGL